VLVSARTGRGLDELKARLAAVARERLVTFEAMVPWSRGDLLAAIHEDGVEITRDDGDDGAWVRALLPRSVAGRIRAELNGGT
jgi:GTP-binding protein HflX